MLLKNLVSKTADAAADAGFASILKEIQANFESSLRIENMKFKWIRILSLVGLTYSLLELSVIQSLIAFLCLLLPLFCTKPKVSDSMFRFYFQSTSILSLLHVIFPALDGSKILLTVIISQVILLINAELSTRYAYLSLLPATLLVLFLVFTRIENTSVAKHQLESHSWFFAWKTVFPIGYFLLLAFLADYKNSLFDEYQELITKLKLKLQELDVLQTQQEQSKKILHAQSKKINLVEQELQESIASRDAVASSLSHELRNPLNVILGNLDLLIMEVKEPKSLEMLESSRDSCELLLSLVNNVLDANKARAGQIELNPQPVLMFPMLQNLWATTSMHITKKGLVGQVSMDRKMPRTLEIDKHRVVQICFNIISNAVKFTSKGFVNLHFSWTPAHLTDSMIHLDEELKHKLSEPSSAIMALEKRRASEENRFNQRSKSLWETSSIDKQASLHDDIIANQSEPDLDGGICPIVKKRPLVYKSKTMINEHSKKAFSIPFTAQKVNSTFAQDLLFEDDLSLELNEQEGFLKIECLDSGCGIAEQLQNRLFKEFTRGDESITRKFGGTGLGLYITNELVNLMGGWITVDTEVGTGTRVCIVIPAKKIPSITSDFPDFSPKKVPSAISNTSNILVVDDNSYNVDILIKFFNKLGLKSIYTASNGKEAVSLFESKGKGFFSMITMDLQMPEMDGFSACRKIREIEARRNDSQTPIIIISGNCSKEEQNQCLSEQGGIRALSFYRKPVSFMDVEALVRKTITQSDPKRVSPDISLKRNVCEIKKKTLLVNGDEFTSDLLETLLRRYDWELESTSDFLRALQALKTSSSIQYLVIDCDKLEGRNEELLQVFRELRRETNEVHEEELCCMVSIIALTSCDDIIQELKGLGFDRVLKKPLRLNNLRDIFCIEAIDFTSALNA